MSSLGSGHYARRSREKVHPVLADLATAQKLLTYLGISIDPATFRAEAEKAGLWPAPTPLFGPTPAKSTNTNTLGKQTSAPASGASVCELYEIAKSKGQSAAIVASLKTKCDASKAADVAIASSGEPLPNSQTAPAAGGMSPVVIGAIAVAVGVVGFVVYSRSKKSKR